MKRASIRLVGIALVMLTAGLMFTTAAQAWQRGQDEASDPKNRGVAYNDGTVRVCRDGLTIQVASSQERNYTLVASTGVMPNHVVIASKAVRLERRQVKTPPIGKRKFSGTFSLSFAPLTVGTAVQIYFEGFDPITATVQDCLLGQGDDDEDDD
jgi:hypothetical protein